MSPSWTAGSAPETLHAATTRAFITSSSGENVYPAEVENVLSELPGIGEVAVVGIADPKWGEVGCAVAVIQSGSMLGAEDLIAHCRSRLARYKVPGKVVFVSQLPRGATGKVLKRQLRADLGLPDPFARS